MLQSLRLPRSCKAGSFGSRHEQRARDGVMRRPIIVFSAATSVPANSQGKDLSLTVKGHTFERLHTIGAGLKMFKYIWKWVKRNDGK